MFKMYALLLVVVELLSFVALCPSPEKIRPCTCAKDESIYCRSLESNEVLLDVVYALKNHGKFYSFNIEDSNFMFLPHDIFKNIKFSELKITSSTFMALTDTDIALEGLEEDLSSIVIYDSEMLNSWDWNVFRNLKYVGKLHVSVGLTSIPDETIKATTLRDLSLEGNQISYIHDTAFADFKQVFSINLRKNSIREVKRSMFPNPATIFIRLDLSYNEIEQLPDDLFENMPRMETVNIEYNKLLILNEKTFKPVWSQMWNFYALGNHFRCDCRMLWIFAYKKYPHVFDAVCEKPMHLANKRLNDLTEKDLWCFYNGKTKRIL